MRRYDHIILGGGFAGLTTALELKNSSVLLVDQAKMFIPGTRLHQAFMSRRLPGRNYNEILRGKNIEFFQSKVITESFDLKSIANDREIQIGNETFQFSNLVLAFGGRQRKLNMKGPDIPILVLADFMKGEFWSKQKKALAANISKSHKPVFFIGGGPTALQMLFEYVAFAAANKLRNRVFLVTADDSLAAEFSEPFRKAIHKKLFKCGVEVLLGTKLNSVESNLICFEDVKSQEEEYVEAAAIFSFPGIIPPIGELECSKYGNVILDNDELESVYAVGDCTKYAGQGLNSSSAQAAVRKGKLVAQNLNRKSTGKDLKQYTYKELGYFLSLGPGDGVGWMIHPDNVLSGPPAMVIKETIEAQYDLFIRGFDTYLPFGNIFMN